MTSYICCTRDQFEAVLMLRDTSMDQSAKNLTFTLLRTISKPPEEPPVKKTGKNNDDTVISFMWLPGSPKIQSSHDTDDHKFPCRYDLHAVPVEFLSGACHVTILHDNIKILSSAVQLLRKQDVTIKHLELYVTGASHTNLVEASRIIGWPVAKVDSPTEEAVARLVPIYVRATPWKRQVSTFNERKRKPVREAEVSSTARAMATPKIRRIDASPTATHYNQRSRNIPADLANDPILTDFTTPRRMEAAQYHRGPHTPPEYRRSATPKYERAAAPEYTMTDDLYDCALSDIDDNQGHESPVMETSNPALNLPYSDGVSQAPSVTAPPPPPPVVAIPKVAEATVKPNTVEGVGRTPSETLKAIIGDKPPSARIPKNDRQERSSSVTSHSSSRSTSKKTKEPSKQSSSRKHGEERKPRSPKKITYERI